MSNFSTAERLLQAKFKQTSNFVSEEAKRDGVYRRKPYSFCLPSSHSIENLFVDIQQSATSYFEQNGIVWHMGIAGKPTNHLCSSQVCCVNFLFPFSDKPRVLAALFRPIFPQLKEMLPMDSDNYVALEWIGEQNYLGEKVSSKNTRTRGANTTSADAAVRFLRDDGLQQIVLIEWKYTESYNRKALHVSDGGTDRTAIYQPLFDLPDCPINKTALPSYNALFYEPFYQLFRQQLLAHEMEKMHELDADIVSLLHISPAQNLALKRVTSPSLKTLGNDVLTVWKRLVQQPSRFQHVSIETLFHNPSVSSHSSMQRWHRYLQQRYTSLYR